MTTPPLKPGCVVRNGARRLQAQARGFEVRTTTKKNGAASVVQGLCRGRQVRQEINNVKGMEERTRAATAGGLPVSPFKMFLVSVQRLQAACRGRHHRHEAQQQAAIAEATSIIQAALVGSEVRSIARARDMWLELQAATESMQAAARGCIARRVVAELYFRAYGVDQVIQGAAQGAIARRRAKATMSHDASVIQSAMRAHAARCETEGLILEKVWEEPFKVTCPGLIVALRQKVIARCHLAWKVALDLEEAFFGSPMSSLMTAARTVAIAERSDEDVDLWVASRQNLIGLYEPLLYSMGSFCYEGDAMLSGNASCVTANMDAKKKLRQQIKSILRCEGPIHLETPAAEWLTYREVCEIVTGAGVTMGYIGSRVQDLCLSHCLGREMEAETRMIHTRERKCSTLLRSLFMYFKQRSEDRAIDKDRGPALLSRAGCLELCQKFMVLCAFPLISRQELRDQWSKSLKRLGKNKTAPLCFGDVIETLCLPPGVECVPISVQDRRCILRLYRKSVPG